MSSTFEADFNKLLKSVVTSPDDSEWFYPSLKKLILEYGEETARSYAESRNTPIYEICLLVKAGLKDINELLLLTHLNENNEDDVYDAALTLSIYDHPKGIETLRQFINVTHPLSKNIHPKTDILPDLKFLNTSNSKILSDLINSK